MSSEPREYEETVIYFMDGTQARFESLLDVRGEGSFVRVTVNMIKKIIYPAHVIRYMEVQIVTEEDDK